ncbi:MAG: histidinol-phosphatase [Bacteroidales bacterium]|jgi:histidinol-phosphatase (PHP family)|nr:histidinol-phosphatase [Bacteroidales bacterium]
MKKTLSNYHTHNYYCDGKESPEVYVKKAIDLGFNALGFSSHAPVLFENEFSILPEKLGDYCAEIDVLKQKYSEQIELFLALEADYIPNKTHDFSYFRKKCKLDYIIGSIHMITNPENGLIWFIDGGKQERWDNGLKEVFGGDIKAGVTAFYHQTNQMIERQKPEILGHFDKIKMHNKNRFFSQEDSWYQNMIQESLQLIKEKDVVMEINTRGIYKGRFDELFPSVAVFQKAHEMGIPLMLNTDAHHPDELLGYYSEAAEIIKMAGIRELWHFSKNGWFSMQIN